MFKEEFCRILENLQVYVTLQFQLSTFGYDIAEDNIGLKIIRDILTLIEGSFKNREKSAEIIERYCWDTLFGKENLIWDSFSNKEIVTLEDLWNFLEKINED